jgi:hypothetical protein
MHHSTLSPHVLHHVDLGSCMCICDRSRGPETGDQKGANLGAFGGPQASSYDDANIVVIKASPGTSHHHP